MVSKIAGVVFEKHGDCAICYVESLSDDVKQLIRRNLTTICHGSHVSDMPGSKLYGYEATVASFLDRYKNKPEKTQKGMIGEFIAHVLLAELFDEFEVATAFFNLEEKSIKKGFDLLLYRSNDDSVWITEVKSGNLHSGKDHNQTATDLLNAAKKDVGKRLAQQETMYWYNAVNAMRASIGDTKSYKQSLLKLLLTKGDAAADKHATSKTNSVVLVSSLFEPLKARVSKTTAITFLEGVIKEELFRSAVVFCIQKETYARVVSFLESEAAGATV